MSGVIPFLSEMSDLIFSLLHYHRHIAIYVVQIIDTPHNCKPCLSFAGFAFCIAVRCGFDKQLYLTSCLIAPNHNTTRKMALFTISQDRQTQVQAGDAMATTNNNRLKFMISVSIVTGKVFHGFCL